MGALQAQYAKNAAQLARLLARAEAGHPTPGITIRDLRARATLYARLARATDEEMDAHLRDAREAGRARLAQINGR